MASVAEALSAISNEKALSLFKAVALSESCDNSIIIIKKLGLTCKVFYSIREKLIDAGLIKTASSGYHLTSFGKIVFSAQAKIEIAIETYWKLKALDSLMMSEYKTNLPAEEYQILVDKLIDNEELKAMLISSIKTSVPEQESKLEFIAHNNVVL
jgi:predicted transcriptional regulator